MDYNRWPLSERHELVTMAPTPDPTLRGPCGHDQPLAALFDHIDSWHRPIGLLGYAGAGKDWLADQLKGFTRVAFADRMRELALRIDPVVTEDPLAVVVQDHGWDYAKRLPEVRRLLQEIGTGVRDLVGEDVWVNAADVIGQARKGPVVVTDVRFPNEARLIERLGGVLVRVIRPGVAPVNGHRSETALDGWTVDLTVLNDPQKIGYKAHDGSPLRPIPVVNALPQLLKLGQQRTHGRVR